MSSHLRITWLLQLQILLILELLSSVRFLRPLFGRGGPFRAGERYALASMPGPPLASLDPSKGRVEFGLTTGRVLRGLTRMVVFFLCLVGAFAIDAGDRAGAEDSYSIVPACEGVLPVTDCDSNWMIPECCGRQKVPSLLDRLEESAVESRADGSRWFLSEYDFDSRGFNVLHFMGSSPLPYGFDMWGFIDIEGADLAGSNREELSRYFLEIDVKRKLWGSGGIIGEYNDLQGTGNSIARLGFFHKPDFQFLSPESGWLAGKGFVAFKVFPYESDGRGAQASLSWNKNFNNALGGRFSAGGFVDVNFKAGATGDQTVVVTEHQVRLRLLEGLHVITEFRLNEFLQDDFGIAPGIQYRF